MKLARHVALSRYLAMNERRKRRCGVEWDSFFKRESFRYLKANEVGTKEEKERNGQERSWKCMKMMCENSRIEEKMNLGRGRMVSPL